VTERENQRMNVPELAGDVGGDAPDFVAGESLAAPGVVPSNSP
jgi:hypothetical protein